jgi:hypothetical protein
MQMSALSEGSYKAQAHMSQRGPDASFAMGKKDNISSQTRNQKLKKRNFLRVSKKKELFKGFDT